MFRRILLVAAALTLLAPVAHAEAPALATHQVSIQLLNANEAPLEGGRVLAWSADYDVSFPARRPAVADAQGRVELRLPAGRYWLFGASAAERAPILLSSGALDLTADLDLRLMPEAIASWRLRAGERTGLETDSLKLAAESHPFIWWSFDTTASSGKVLLSKAVELRGELLGRQPLGPFLLAARQGPDGLAFHGSTPKTGYLRWQPAKRSAVERLEVKVRVTDDGIVSHSFDLAPDQALLLDCGPFDLTYWYARKGLGTLRFGRRAHTLEPAGTTLAIGGPLTPTVWHHVYPRRYQKLPPYSLRVFLQDAQGHLLQPDGRRNRSGVSVSLTVIENGEPQKKPVRLRRFAADLDVAPADLNQVRYRLKTRLPLTTGEVPGTPPVELESEHYRIVAPTVLEEEARRLLEAAELILPGLRQHALTQRWKRGSIMIHATMPPGVRAFASSRGGSNFNMGDLARCTRLRDALTNTPIMHEHLHTVGYQHSDYMDLAGFRIRRALDPEGAFWMGHAPKSLAGATLASLEEGTRQKKGGKVLARTLLKIYGPELFDGYLARRKQRRQLVAQGLSEKEADCVLFSQVAGEDLGALFKRYHPGIDTDAISRMLAEPNG